MFDWKNETESEPRYIEQIDHKKCTEKMLFNKMKREKIYKTKILSLSFSVAFFVLLPFAYFTIYHNMQINILYSHLFTEKFGCTGVSLFCGFVGFSATGREIFN